MENTDKRSKNEILIHKMMMKLIKRKDSIISTDDPQMAEYLRLIEKQYYDRVFG